MKFSSNLIHKFTPITKNLSFNKFLNHVTIKIYIYELQRQTNYLAIEVKIFKTSRSSITCLIRTQNQGGQQMKIQKINNNTYLITGTIPNEKQKQAFMTQSIITKNFINHLKKLIKEKYNLTDNLTEKYTYIIKNQFYILLHHKKRLLFPFIQRLPRLL